MSGDQLDLFSRPTAAGAESSPGRPDAFLAIEGLEYYERVLADSEAQQVLAEIDACPWLAELDRRVQHYGYKYDYRARRIDAAMRVGPLPSFALRVVARLCDRRIVVSLPDQAIVNEYVPGQGISNHVDCVPCFEETVVTVSLGDAWEMEFTNPNTKEIRRAVLQPGSALRLRGPARYHWLHGIKRRLTESSRPRKRRISLTFRNVIIATR